MNRSKLEYFSRSLSIDKERQLRQAVDPDGNYMFGKIACDFLKDPDTKDKRIINRIPGHTNPQLIEDYKNRYRSQYERINNLCKENKIYPFFEDPRDIKKSEATRQDIIQQVPEAVLNKFFNVNSFYEYVPPVYEPGTEMGE